MSEKLKDGKGFFTLRNLFFLLVFILFITNPSEEYHRKVVKDKLDYIIKEETKESLFGELAYELGNSQVENFVNKSVYMDNYYIFSLTKSIDENFQEETIGIGIFLNVFLLFNEEDLMNDE
jgi:hypothetical protein